MIYLYIWLSLFFTWVPFAFEIYTFFKWASKSWNLKFKNHYNNHLTNFVIFNRSKILKIGILLLLSYPKYRRWWLILFSTTSIRFKRNNKPDSAKEANVIFSIELRCNGCIFKVKLEKRHRKARECWEKKEKIYEHQ